MDTWISFWTLVLIAVMVVYGMVTIWVAIRGLSDIFLMLRQLKRAADRPVSKD